jgi:hypothetical protein
MANIASVPGAYRIAPGVWLACSGRYRLVCVERGLWSVISVATGYTTYARTLIGAKMCAGARNRSESR